MGQDSGHVRFEELVIPIYLPNLPRNALVILDHPNSVASTGKNERVMKECVDVEKTVKEERIE